MIIKSSVRVNSANESYFRILEDINQVILGWTTRSVCVCGGALCSLREKVKNRSSAPAE